MPRAGRGPGRARRDIARTNAVLPPIGFCAGSPGEEHWPRFAPHAREAGVVAIAAVPLRTSETTVGALNLVNTGKPVIPVTDLRIAQAFTEAAMGCFAHHHRVNGLKQVVSQLEGALHSRVSIEQAKGVLSERFHIPLDEAFARLRGYARSRSLKLRALANDVAHGRGPSCIFSDDGTPLSPPRVSSRRPGPVRSRDAVRPGHPVPRAVVRV
ncbi:ANTAR domain-containing protein [Amycolatopsis thailandensis]|uniref:ANTAR domain-containing protein n=1 Tax=Amycolatopsis thailandensis TaxID=589330 RepID=UPI00363A1E79